MLLEAYAEQYNKREAQTVGKLVLRNRPLQDILFNYVCFKSEANNGVARISYDELLRELERKTGTTRTKQAVSKMVKAIVSAGLFEYHSEKNGAKNEIGYFRIAPLKKLHELAGIIKEKVIVKVQEVKEAVVEKVEAGKELVEEIVSKVSKAISSVATPKRENKPSKSNYKPYNNKGFVRKEIVPDWFAARDKPYVPPVRTEEEQAEFEKSKEELQRMLQEKYKK